MTRLLTTVSLIVGVCLVISGISTHSVFALTAQDRYNSGYSHGCSDGKIGSHSYLVGSGGASHHTADFMRGYNAGYAGCTVLGGAVCTLAGTLAGALCPPAKGSWILDVRLTNPPFGITNVNVQVKGPFGSQYNQRINWQQEVNRQGALGPIHVKFSIPPNVIPSGYQFQVCISHDLVSIFLPHCQYFPRQSSVAMSVR